VRLSNTTDTPSPGELGNAGAVSASASASEAEEVDESDVWMKRGKWKGVELDESEAKGVTG